MRKDPFPVDTLISEEDICNLSRERKFISKEIQLGHKVLVFGKRNTGKTSLVKNVIAAQWQKKEKKAIVFYVDLYGVKNITQVTARVANAYSWALKRNQPLKGIGSTIVDVLKSFRPVMKIEADGTPTLSLDLDAKRPEHSLYELFSKFNNLYEKDVSILIVIDEFQEIHGIDECEGIFRDTLQNLNPNIPVIIMGSKKHLLSLMFTEPKAAFFSWGQHVEFSVIDYKEYYEYLKDRFNEVKLSLSYEDSIVIQDLMLRNPEAINRICSWIFSNPPSNKRIDSTYIHFALGELVEGRRSAMEEYLKQFTPAEDRVMAIFAKEGGVIKQPMKKDFLKAADVSVSGMKGIVIKLENDAVLYKEKEGYVFADALLKQHLVKFR